MQVLLNNVVGMFQGLVLAILKLETEFRIAVRFLSFPKIHYILEYLINQLPAFFFSKNSIENCINLQGYRLITGLAARPWFLVEICSRQEIISILTDSYMETTKIGIFY